MRTPGDEDHCGRSSSIFLRAGEGCCEQGACKPDQSAEHDMNHADSPYGYRDLQKKWRAMEQPGANDITDPATR